MAMNMMRALLALSLMMAGDFLRNEVQGAPQTTTPPSVSPGRFPFERPKTIEKERKPMALPEPKVAEFESATNTLFIAGGLKGIIFVSAQAEVVLDAEPTFGVVVRNIPLLQSTNFNSRMQRFLGNPVRLSTLHAMEAEVWKYFRSRGFPLVTAVVTPDQNFANDVLQMVVIEGKISAILVKNEGREWFSSSQIRKEIRQPIGEPLDSRKLEADLDWLNRNPFRSVSPNLRAGINFGETAMTLDVEDRMPLRGYIGYEDTGTELLGVERFVAGFNYGNLFGLAQEFNYQYTADIDSTRLHAHTMTYSIPLPWRHSINLLGAFVDVDTDSNPIQKGKNVLASFRYGIPLRSSGSFRHELTGGFDYKRIETATLFGGTASQTGDAEVLQFELGYAGSWADSFGYNSFSLEGFYSPGEWLNQNDDESFDTLRPNSVSSYGYVTLQADRTTRLPYDFSWLVGIQAQFSSDRLLSSEEFGLGGYNNVRGYDERIASGDGGFVVRNELRLPPIKLPKIQGRESSLQFLTFVDAGRLKVVDRSAVEPSSVDLSSVGFGLRFMAGKSFSLRADYGFQLNRDETGNDGNEIQNGDGTLNRAHSRAHIGAVLSF